MEEGRKGEKEREIGRKRKKHYTRMEYPLLFIWRTLEYSSTMFKIKYR